ncbi:MAG: cytidine deaminase [Alistipes sp.]|nr:cytidine deaminase [Alistipes sp.]
MEKQLSITYHHFDSIDLMPQADQELVAAAREATRMAHAPYSHFRVGAAARLESGEVVAAANCESEVYPSGMCAERVLLYNLQTSYAEQRIEALAIASDPSERECYPCGACRQTLLDAQKRQQSPIRIIMSSSTTATVVEDAELLLPFSFKL